MNPAQIILLVGRRQVSTSTLGRWDWCRGTDKIPGVEELSSPQPTSSLLPIALYIEVQPESCLHPTLGCCLESTTSQTESSTESTLLRLSTIPITTHTPLITTTPSSFWQSLSPSPRKFALPAFQMTSPPHTKALSPQPPAGEASGTGSPIPTSCRKWTSQ